MKMAKQAWKWAIAAGEDQAWLYFIFGVCQWLPTNYRVHYTDESAFDRTKCVLCLMDAEENMSHLFVCPALASEHCSLRMAIEEKLKEWDVPWAQGRMETSEHRTCRDLVQKARENLRNELISTDRLRILAHGFWQVNHVKGEVSAKRFTTAVRKVLARYSCQSDKKENVACKLRQSHTLPESLLKILSQNLCVYVEARTDSLHRSPVFTQWCSDDVADNEFGAKPCQGENSLVGKNSFLQFYPEDDKGGFGAFCDSIRDQIASKCPTRMVLILRTDRVAEIERRKSITEVLSCARSTLAASAFHLQSITYLFRTRT